MYTYIYIISYKQQMTVFSELKRDFIYRVIYKLEALILSINVYVFL